MNVRAHLLILLAASAILPAAVQGQSENVPANHPVYAFLDRMETRGIIESYHDAVLPISRREVAARLVTIRAVEGELTFAENQILAQFISEFRFDIDGMTEEFSSLIGESPSSDGGAVWDLLSDREHFLYVLRDSSVSLFFSGLLTADVRHRSGDELNADNSFFLQFGGRFRGTLFNHLGYFLQGTNAQFWGSRDLLRADPVIGQAYTLNVLDARNFDFAEGYLRYDADIVSAEVGRERLLWGLGMDQKMVVSDNVPVYDFIRAEARYKSLQYVFMHAWLLGRNESLFFTLPGDTSTLYTEPVNADKYIAAHRLELSLPGAVDLGFQEMVIYANRAPDLAYLNPLILIESAQRSRAERDNVFWAVDAETHFLRGLQLAGTILFDDIHFAEFFLPRWYNRYAYQASAFLTDPLFPPNTNMIVEYTRVEPFVFAHSRSREGSYSSEEGVLGPRIGPNADAWHIRFDWFPTGRLSLSLRSGIERSGENTYDQNGVLIRNVGGDIFQPHRPTDPIDRQFLDGTSMQRTSVQALATYEACNQVWGEGWYRYESTRNVTLGTSVHNHTFGLRVRMEL